MNKKNKVEKPKQELFFTAQRAQETRRKIAEHNKSKDNWLLNFFK